MPVGVREETEAPAQSIHKNPVDTIGKEGLLFVGKRWQSLAISTRRQNDNSNIHNLCVVQV
jgi:hypothetical protein